MHLQLFLVKPKLYQESFLIFQRKFYKLIPKLLSESNRISSFFIISLPQWKQFVVSINLLILPVTNILNKSNSKYDNCHTFL